MKLFSILAVALSAAFMWISTPAVVADPTYDHSNNVLWIGTGINQATLVIDWHDEANTQSSLAWGYRWEDVGGAMPTVETMLRAIVSTDSRLSWSYDEYGSSIFVTSISYNGSASGGVDLTAAGGGNSYWALFYNEGNPYGAGSWVYSKEDGVSSLNLENNAFYGMSFLANWTIVVDPDLPVAAIPEPSAVLWLGVGFGVLVLWRRAQVSIRL